MSVEDLGAGLVGPLGVDLGLQDVAQLLGVGAVDGQLQAALEERVLELLTASSRASRPSRRARSASLTMVFDQVAWPAAPWPAEGLLEAGRHRVSPSCIAAGHGGAEGAAEHQEQRRDEDRWRGLPPSRIMETKMRRGRGRCRRGWRVQSALRGAGKGRRARGAGVGAGAGRSVDPVRARGRWRAMQARYSRTGSMTSATRLGDDVLGAVDQGDDRVGRESTRSTRSGLRANSGPLRRVTRITVCPSLLRRWGRPSVAARL